MTEYTTLLVIFGIIIMVIEPSSLKYDYIRIGVWNFYINLLLYTVKQVQKGNNKYFNI